MSQSPDNSPPSTPFLTALEQHSEYSPEERILLLRLAHEAIESALDGREISLEAPTPHLSEQRGAFTSLYMHGELRGCVGYVLPVASVYRTVAETARAAAFEDRRFFPVRADEAPALCVSLSILSSLSPIRPENIVVGRHGLLVSLGAHRGLLLPQVPVEHVWDVETFLEQTCHKAGLPADAWREGAKLEAFTAEVFGEAGTPDGSP
jgi:AmmeMemoRadiSam system protein A